MFEQHQSSAIFTQLSDISEFSEWSNSEFKDCVDIPPGTDFDYDSTQFRSGSDADSEESDSDSDSDDDDGTVIVESAADVDRFLANTVSQKQYEEPRSDSDDDSTSVKAYHKDKKYCAGTQLDNEGTPVEDSDYSGSDHESSQSVGSSESDDESSDCSYSSNESTVNSASSSSSDEEEVSDGDPVEFMFQRKRKYTTD